MKLKKTIKNVLILGDSHSTFTGFIPEEYRSWYGPGEKPEKTDVFRVEDTWWHLLSEELKFNVVRNDSFSGSTIAYFPECIPFQLSFIERFESLVKNGFFNREIDTVFVYGGANDSFRELPLGKIKYESFEESELHSVRPAICYLTKRLKEVLPEANIIFIIITRLKPEITDAIKAASDFYNTFYIELQDIERPFGHPNVLGMMQIKEQIKSFIENT